MNDRLKQFLGDAFKPYGDFPSRKDVEQELLANLTEKYQDLKSQGKSDDEAYQLTIDSFGDVSEIMEQVRPAAAKTQEANVSLGKSLKDIFKRAKHSKSKFSAVELKQSDLSDSNLVGADFSATSLAETNFDGANLTDAAFVASDVRKSSFKGANLTSAAFMGSAT
jgi:uncharacterized protein YjbI with pentapeptide repeats